MKLAALFNAAFGAHAALQLAENKKRVHHRNHLTLSSPVLYGDTRCPCIGFDNIEGDTIVQAEMSHGEKVEVSYPADLGARCEAWDNNRLPQCQRGAKPGSDELWCAQQWCYVDPCKCDIDVMPKMTAMLPGVTYRGKPLFWSYATCGGKDMFSKKKPTLGNPKCQCIGFAGVEGTTDVSIKGKTVEYPADMGSTCTSWDSKVHPECQSDRPPPWCRANWCYVDPCECDLPGETVPKIAVYLPRASFTGKNLYYSYETCGSPDTFTEKNNPDACVNQETEEECQGNSRCSWTGSRCLGTELVNHPLCKKAAAKIIGHSGAFARHYPSAILLAFLALSAVRT
jgi:hypothetical protein